MAGLVSSDNGLRRQLNEADVIAGRKPEMRAYEPTLMDQLRYKAIDVLAPLFGGDERAANAYYRDKVQPTAEFLPGVGDAMAAAEAKDAFGQGDYLGGSLLAAGAAAGLVPGVGDVVQKGTRALADALEKSAKARGVDLSLSARGNQMTVNKIVVPKDKRNQGVGSDVMRGIVDAADANQINLALTPSADFGGNKRQLEEFYKRFGFEPNAGRSRDYEISETMRRYAQQPAKSPIQQRGDEVLGLLKSGRANQVTDEMLDLGNAADNANLNAYLFENYDLPMDTPSRMRRAEDDSFDMMNDFYHGTVLDGYNDTTDILAVDPSRSGDRWGADDMGFSITNSTQDANYYAKPGEFARKGELRGGAIYPLMDKSTNPLDMRVGPMDGTISAWDERPADTYDVLKAGKHDAARLQSDGVEMRVVMDPANIRSRFARFDPRLKHLRNLSAGVGGGAVLANEIAKIIAGQKDDQTVY